MWKSIVSTFTTLTFVVSNLYKPNIEFNPLHQYMARSMPCRSDKDCFYMYMGCVENKTKPPLEPFATWDWGKRNSYSPL